MEQQIWDLGLPRLGGVPWGTHICHFFESKEELCEILVPYFRVGLERNQCCLWVCSDPVGVQEASEALRGAVSGFDRYRETGQLQVFHFHEWYLGSDGSFAPERVVSRWKDKLSEAASAGYAGVRIAGNASWVEKHAWRAFTQYEAGLSGVIAKENVLVVCSYPYSTAKISEVVDVVKNHQYALVKNDLGWDLIECGRYWEREFESLLNDIQDGVLVVGERGEILASNRALLECFGVTSICDLGTNLLVFAEKFRLRPEEPDGHSFLRAVLRGGSRRGYWSATLPGAHGNIELSIRTRAVRPASFFSKRYLVSIHDVTEIRRLERMKDRFIQLVGHELKNPIQVMKALVPLMSTLESSDASALRRYTKTLEGQINQLLFLIEDLLSVCAVGNRELPLFKNVVDFVDLVADWVDFSAIDRSREVIRILPACARAPVYVDGRRIRGVLANVFGNAVKYSPEGTRIWIRVKVQDDSALVIIEDEGVGIPKSESEKVFQAFYRGSNVVRDSLEGAGIGLFVSRLVARQHDGDLWAEEREGGGTRMVLRLPLLEAQTDLTCGSGVPDRDLKPELP